VVVVARASLAVDPSSPVTGGSILGDKTRMQRLAVAEGAYIRPTPAGDAMGGVAHRTREASLLCEAAGYDVVIIETVGVGQSEHAVQAIVDTFVVLLAPGGGDDLQGVKRGIIELADVLVINKADDERLAEAHTTAAAYRNAGRLFRRPRWQPPVVLASARNETGLDDVWAAVQAHRAAWGSSLTELRQHRLEREVWRVVATEAVAQVRSHPHVQAMIDDVSLAVAEGRLSPAVAAQHLLRAAQS
jgi:LAO/AO transport system kinase